MADRLLLESGGTDGYLLENGSGVLLQEYNSAAIINSANTTVTSLGSGTYTVVKTGGTDFSWDSLAVSTASYTGSIRLRISPSQGWSKFGISTAPGTAEFSPNYSFQFAPGSGGGTYYSESPSTTVAIGGANWNTGDVFWIDYDQTTGEVKYYKGADFATATLLRTATGAPNSPYYFDGQAYNTSGGAEVLFIETAAAVDRNAITGTAALTFSPSGSVVGIGTVTGSSTLTFAPSATVSGRGALTGSSTLTFAPSATVTGKGPLTGSSSLTFAPSGTIAGKGSLTGSSTLTFAPTGTLAGFGAVTGSSSISFAPGGTITGRGAVTGASTLTFAGSGTISGAGGPTTAITGSASLTFSAVGNVVGIAPLSGSASFVFTLSGTLTGPFWAATNPESPVFDDSEQAEATWTAAAATGGFSEIDEASGTWTEVPANSGTWN